MADKKKVEQKGTANKKTGPASTVPKKLSNKDIRKARQAAKRAKEKIPAGMDPKDYADAAFKKKVTIIMGSILLAFVLGLTIFLVVSKVQYDFEGQRDDIKQALIEAGDNPEERAKVKIEVNEKNHNFWINTLDESYQIDVNDPDYACFEGATITLQGQFVTRVIYGKTEYWVYRTHEDHEHAADDHDHEESESLAMGETTTENKDTKIPKELINDPIVVFLEDGAEIPKDGTWVEITGIVGPDSSNSLAAVHDAQMKVIEAP